MNYAAAVKQGEGKQQQPEPAIQKAGEAVKEGVRQNIDTTEVKKQIEEPINKGLEAARIPGRVRLNKEQLDRLVDRFVKFIDNLSQDERLNRMFRELLNLFDLFSSEIGLPIPTSRKMKARLEQGQAPSKEEVKQAGKQIGDKAMEKAKQAGTELQQAVTQTADEMRRNRHLQRALTLSKELFERFTNGKSLDDLLDQFYSLYRVMQKDAKALNVYQELRRFFDRVLDDPTIMKRDEGKREFRRFIKHFRQIQTKKIQNHLSKAINEANDLLEAIQNDPTIKRLRSDMKRLLNDLILDEHGQFTWKPEVLDQIRVLLVRAVIERMRIPLPPIRSVDGTMVYKISNMIIDVKDILPETVEIKESARLKLDLSQLGDKNKSVLSDATSRLKVDMKHINLNIKDMDVRFKRLSFPKLSDRGRAKLDLADQGMDIHLGLAIYPGTYRIFRIEDLRVDVNQINLELYGTSHDFLYSMFLPFIRNRVKTDIEDGVEHMIRLYLDQLNRIAAKQMRKMREGAQQFGEGGQYSIYSFARRISDALPEAPSMESMKSTFQDISNKVSSTVSSVTEGESSAGQEPSPKKKRT